MVLGSKLIRIMRDGREIYLMDILDNFDVNYVVDQMGSTFLHYSAIAGNLSVTMYLLQRNCSPDVQDVNGITPIMLAIQNRHNAVVRMLLRYKVDIGVVRRCGRSALQLALNPRSDLCTKTMQTILKRVREDYSCPEALFDKLLEPGCQLYHLVFLRDFRLTRRMLDLGYSVNTKHPIYGYTALHIAASLIDLKNVRLLTRYGADAVDRENQTPLFYLNNYSVELSPHRLKILRIFLDSKASLMTLTNSGFYQVAPTLSRACREGIRRVMQSNALDFTASDAFDGKTALHYLAMNKNPGMIHELKSYASKFDVNALDNSGWNPLYFATENGNALMLEFLLENGANANVRHKTLGFTPLCYAALKTESLPTHQFDRCTELLLRHNADAQVAFLFHEDGETLTIFDSGLTSVTFDRVMSVVAQLAILQS